MLTTVGAGPLAGTYVTYDKSFYQHPIYFQLHLLSIKRCKKTKFDIISYIAWKVSQTFSHLALMQM